MAYLKGDKTFTGRNLVGTIRKVPARDPKPGKAEFFYAVDAQLDLRDPRCARETNPHLESHPYETTAPDGGKTQGVSHSRVYSVKQGEAMMKAFAVQPALDQKGNPIPDTFEFAGKADLCMPRPREVDGKKVPATGVLINTAKEMGASDFPLEPDTMKNQYAAKMQAKAARDNERKAAKEGPAAPAKEAAEAQAQTGELEID